VWSSVGVENLRGHGFSDRVDNFDVRCWGGKLHFGFDDYLPGDETKPEAMIVTTENDRHLEILRECAKRHIHYSTEKPMATNAAHAREMERLANRAGIKVMVNYWNAGVAPTHDFVHRVRAGQLGPVKKIIVQYGHAGPKEIGVSKDFAE
jgi:predicted dehydrogenase